MVDQFRQPWTQGGFTTGERELADGLSIRQWCGGNGAYHLEHRLPGQHDAANGRIVIEDRVAALATEVAVLIEVVVDGFGETADLRLHGRSLCHHVLGLPTEGISRDVSGTLGVKADMPTFWHQIGNRVGKSYIIDFLSQTRKPLGEIVSMNLVTSEENGLVIGKL